VPPAWHGAQGQSLGHGGPHGTSWLVLHLQCCEGTSTARLVGDMHHTHFEDWPVLH
jgi:hypothetical protein